MIMTEHTNETIQALRQNIRYFLKWTFISAISGVTIGLAGTLFGLGIQKATAFWKSHSWTLYLLPLVGLLIVWLYRFAHEEKNRGTDMVLDSISSTEEVTPATAPLIFISTLLSHLATASVGREGAALQLGGSLGNLIGKAFRLDEKDRKIAIMCGMSAGFSAIFGTPLAAAVFAMEVISIGVMYYAALVPCVFSAFVGVSVAKFLGLAPEHYEIGLVPEKRLRAVEEKYAAIEKEIKRLEHTGVAPSPALTAFLTEHGTADAPDGCSLLSLLKRPQLHYAELAPFDPGRPPLSADIAEEIEISVKYEGYIKRQLQQVAEFKRVEGHKLPPDMDYNAIQGLRLEAREKLSAVRPMDLGQASRISGVSPADLTALMIWLENKR